MTAFMCHYLMLERSWAPLDHTLIVQQSTSVCKKNLKRNSLEAQCFLTLRGGAREFQKSHCWYGHKDL